LNTLVQAGLRIPQSRNIDLVTDGRSGVEAAGLAARSANVRYGSKADVRTATRYVRFIPNCDCKSGYLRFVMSALPPKADICSAT
jgi:hypothetical protein